MVEPQRILDHREIMLQRQVIPQVKVQWKHFSPEETTWEDENSARDTYPEMFK